MWPCYQEYPVQNIRKLCVSGKSEYVKLRCSSLYINMKDLTFSYCLYQTVFIFLLLFPLHKFIGINREDRKYSNCSKWFFPIPIVLAFGDQNQFGCLVVMEILQHSAACTLLIFDKLHHPGISIWICLFICFFKNPHMRCPHQYLVKNQCFRENWDINLSFALFILLVG